ncbi:enoyl-CoA hydratase/isomerase family protein [Nitratireductor sp. ZSWI3]|uniref:enoyl-CoA hydratase/isomerase family protein n=1 Tax=Nitratireductor sp. ZSWI3 TaxID=2966359 RepID=UPI00214FFA89|nr:enoyl-CoA hydratase-related protein [Nitratireductor sp. ZSWI3]MCR4266463.1 enoyl-CoA hydratase-related protein [Nitratireductor sp. ZSWI3]
MAADMPAQERGFSVSTDDRIVRLRLERPHKRNAVTRAMWQDLAETVERIGNDEAARVIVVSGAGDHFCAGADIAEFETVRRDAETARAYEALNAAAFAALRNCRKPTLAAISGVCFGGGFGLAAACDLRIATPDARFAVPAARLGLAYPVEAMGDIVAGVGAQMARYLTFSGASIDAQRALDCGFLLEIVEASALEARVAEIAGLLAGAAPLSIRASKAAIAAALTGRQDDAARAQALGDETFESADYAEGRAAFHERRTARFIGR